MAFSFFHIVSNPFLQLLVLVLEFDYLSLQRSRPEYVSSAYRLFDFVASFGTISVAQKDTQISVKSKYHFCNHAVVLNIGRPTLGAILLLSKTALLLLILLECAYIFMTEARLPKMAHVSDI